MIFFRFNQSLIFHLSSFIFHFPKVLPFVPGLIAKLNGVVGAVVVAGEAGEAAARVFPFGGAAFTAADVVHHAHFGAQSALGATVGLHAELLVADEPSYKCRAQQAAVDAWPMSFVGAHDAALAGFYFLGKYLQLLGSTIQFLLLFLGLVNVHEGQTYIRLGHNERIETLGSNAHRRSQVAVQNLHCLADVVACRHERIAKVSFGSIELQAAHKLPDDEWWTPAVNGKHKPDTFTLGQLVMTVAAECVGNEDERVASGFGQLLCGPSGIARSRKIEYHAAKLHKKE